MQHCRKQIVAATIAAFLLGTGARGAEVPKPTNIAGGLQLTIETEKPAVPSGEPIPLKIVLKNVSQTVRWPFSVSTTKDYQWLVKDEKGNAVPLTAFGRLWTGDVYISGYNMQIPAGQQVESVVRLNRIVDMTNLGNYSVTVARTVPGEQGAPWVTLTSNTVQIAVAPGKDEPVKIVPSVPLPTPVATAKPTLPMNSWREGDVWKLAVELLTTSLPANGGANDEPRTLARYEMLAKIVGSDVANDGAECWQVDFLPERNAPSSVVNQPYRVLVGKSDGLPHMIIGLRGYGNAPVDNYGEGVFATRDALHGYPAEFLPMHLEKPFHGGLPSGGWGLKLENQTSQGVKTIEAQVTKDGNEIVTVKQEWQPGAKWWSRYEKRDARRQMILRVRPIQNFGGTATTSQTSDPLPGPVVPANAGIPWGRVGANVNF